MKNKIIGCLNIIFKCSIIIGLSVISGITIACFLVNDTEWLGFIKYHQMYRGTIVIIMIIILISIWEINFNWKKL